MYVIVLMSKYTKEIFGVQRNLSNEPCRFQDYGTALRAAIEKNYNVRKDEFVWIVKEDDGVYFKLKESLNE